MRCFVEGYEIEMDYQELLSNHTRMPKPLINPHYFFAKVLEKGLLKWGVHQCGFCNYHCGFVFYHGACEVGYDNGCYCTEPTPIIPCDFEEVCNFYHSETDLETKNKYNEFWGINHD